MLGHHLKMYYHKALCLTVFIINYVNADLKIELQKLTEHFFANLRNDPYIQEVDFNETSKAFIDHQVNNFLEVVKNVYAEKKTVNQRNRRSADNNMNKEGFYILEGFEAVGNIPVNNPKEIVLFKQLHENKENWYAAVLECEDRNNEANLLSIFKYQSQHQNFTELGQVKIKNGTKIATHTTLDFTLLVVAEYIPFSDTYKPNVYKFSVNERLYRVQSIKASYATDVVIWEMHSSLYLTIAQEKIVENITKFEIQSPIYKWKGEHFDHIDNIKTCGAKKIMPIRIQNNYYLVVANFQNNDGNTNIYSNVYKYDLQLDKFILHQRLLTAGALDVKHFCFKSKHQKDDFLAIANTHHSENVNKMPQGVDSIIYKFIDGYFLPFQDLRLPSTYEWLPVMGPNSEFVLLASTTNDGIMSYQYDGWKFYQMYVDYGSDFFPNGFTSMNFYNLNDETTIVVANINDKGLKRNVIKPKFRFDTSMVDNMEEMQSWCLKTLEETKKQNLKSIHLLNSDIEINKPKEHVLQSAALRNEEEEGEILEVITEKLNLNKLRDLQLRLQTALTELQEVQEKMDRSMSELDDKTFRGSIEADEVIISNINSINELIAETINDVDVAKFLKNTLDIQSGFIMPSAKIEDITVKNNFEAKILNGNAAKDLVYNRDNITLNNVIIKGEAVFLNGFEQKGLLNKIDVEPQKILLVEDDQHFAGTINTTIVKVDNVASKFLNKINLNELHTNNGQPISNLTSITVDELTVGGELNNVNIQKFLEGTLKSDGRQSIFGNYTFNKLFTRNVDIRDRINGKILPKDIILTDNGTFHIEQDVKFNEDVKTKKLQVNKRLNRIEVVLNKLDVILRNTTELQYITGKKIFEHVDLSQSIKLIGNLNDMELRGPLVIIEKPVVVTGNFLILGNVTIEKQLHVNDIISKSEKHSLNHVLSNGLLLNAIDIPVQLEFFNQLSVQEVFVDNINGLGTNKWVVAGKAEPYHITGYKKIRGDLYITGNTLIHYINDIELQKLEDAAFKIEGDQKITGTHTFQKVNAPRITSKTTQINQNDWGEVLAADKILKMPGTTILNNAISIKHLEARNLKLKKKLNGFNVSRIFSDTVFQNDDRMLAGKYFKSISITDLHAKNIDIKELPTRVHGINAKFQIDQDIILPGDISIENITYTKSLNGFSDFDMTEKKARNRGDVPEDLFYEKVTVLGQAFINSNSINNIDINEMLTNAVKIDDNHQFQSAIFETHAISPKEVIVRGQIEGIDLDNLISDNEFEQQILDKKVFLQNVTIVGCLDFVGLVNELNLTSFCNYIQPKEHEHLKTLVVNGSAQFLKGPILDHVNGIHLREATKDAWFSNQPISFQKQIEFKDVYFNDDVKVHGYVNGIKLEQMAKNIFTLNTNQTIPATMLFQNQMNFAKGIFAKELNIKGRINGILLSEFLQTIILDGVDQIFERKLHLDSCHLMNSQGSFTINGYDIHQDLMRYDRSNFVTGSKIIKKVIMENAILEKDINIQSVNIQSWIERAITKSGVYFIKTNTTLEKTAVFSKNIGIDGNLNNIKFTKENILLKSENQELIADFVFNSLNPLTFNTIKLKGKLNGQELSEFIHTQAYKHQDVIFNSPIYIEQSITADNVKFDHFYNGKNVSLILENIKKVDAFISFSDNYNELHETSIKIHQSLIKQAFTIDYYQVRQEYGPYIKVFPLKFADKSRLALFYERESKFIIDFHKWDEIANQFILDGDIANIIIQGDVSYIENIPFSSGAFMFVETIEDGNSRSPIYNGHILEIFPDKLYNFKLQQNILSNGTMLAKSFELLDHRKCCLFIGQYDFIASIYCQKTRSDNLYFHQRIGTGLLNKVATLNIFNNTYVFIISHEKNTNPFVAVWTYNKQQNRFDLLQTLYTSNPNDVSVISYHNVHYLAISSGYVQDDVDSGFVHIKRFNTHAGIFTNYIDLKVVAPKTVEFAILPTNELILYILTDNPAEPMILYLYKGISGFVKDRAGLMIPKSLGLTQFSTASRHFVVIETDEDFKIIEGVLQGGIHDFE